jgi:hypothetical protein
MIRLSITLHRRLQIATLALALAAAAPAQAIDFGPAAPGNQFEYECNSNIPNPINPARTTEITIKQIEAGMVTYATMVNGAARLEIRQPLSLYGTSLVEQISSRKGTSRIVSGLDKFPSLRDLEVGATRQGKVEWVYESGKHATWDVSITISDEAQRRTNPFGYIPVIVVEETWTGPRTTITSKTYISPERSAVVGWLNEVGSYGVEECWLTGIRTP